MPFRNILARFSTSAGTFTRNMEGGRHIILFGMSFFGGEGLVWFGLVAVLDSAIPSVAK